MLKQDTVPETQTAPVGQARVTPEELAQALAAIDARRQAEAAHLAGTIPIDQAVSDLHLDSTPDEIWTEVQAQRAESSAVRRAKTDRTQEPLPQTSMVPPAKRRRGWRRVLAPVLVIGLLYSAGVIPHFSMPHFWTSRTSATVPVLRPLSEVPSGAVVYADSDALAQISAGKPLSQIVVSEKEEPNQWHLLKMGGHVYLRGYTAKTATVQELEGRGLNIYNDDDSGDLHDQHTFSVTVRVDNIPLQRSGGDSNYTEVTIPNFHFDPSTTFSPWQ